MTKAESFYALLVVCAQVEGQPVELTAPKDSEDMIKQIRACYDRNIRNIIISLAQVTAVNEDTLLRVFCWYAPKKNLNVLFCSPKKSVKDTLDGSSIYGVIELYATAEEAFNSLLPKLEVEEVEETKDAE